jgi:putative hydrolase of the HAD superfamily
MDETHCPESEQPKRDLKPGFEAIDTWIFDLDNTLYPSSCDLFAEIEVRMGAFITQRLGLDREAAHALRRDYYRTYGTTLAGLMAVNGVDPHHFMRFVHEVDLSVVPPNPALDRHLKRLPGRKVIFTNGSVAYAERVLERVGIRAHFELIFDIEAARFVPKPAPETLDALLARLVCDPARAVFFDDLPANLVPARERGLTTVLIKTHKSWAATADVTVDAHHTTEDLTLFLAEQVLHPEPD